MRNILAGLGVLAGLGGFYYIFGKVRDYILDTYNDIDWDQ